MTPSELKQWRVFASRHTGPDCCFDHRILTQLLNLAEDAKNLAEFYKKGTELIEGHECDASSDKARDFLEKYFGEKE